VEELRRRVWWERVHRAIGTQRHTREFGDACHDILRQIHDYGGNATRGAQHHFDGPGMSDAQASMYWEYLDRLGKIAGTGPYPGEEPRTARSYALSEE
jgi:hypothetical protein